MGFDSLPEGWKCCKLKDVGTVVSGGTPPTKDSDNFDGDIAWITPADLSGYKGKYISNGKRNLSQKGYDACSAKLMPRNSVLFTSRAPIGYVAIANNEICTNQGFKSVVPNGDVDSEYLYYYLKYIKDFIISKASGTTFKEISLKAITEIPVILLPKDIQKQVAMQLEVLLSELDNGISELQKAHMKLRLLSSSILKDAFSNHTSFDYLSNHADMCLGKMLDKNKNMGDYQAYIRNQNVRWFHFNMSDLIYRRITKDDYDRYSIQKSDLVICEGGAPGRCAIWENNDSVFFQKALHRVRVKETLDSYFLMYYLWYMTLTGQLEQHFTGTTINHLTGRELKKVPVPILRKEQQIEIVQRLKANLSICNEIAQKISESLQKAETLRQSILKQAFEGKLV